MNAYYELLRVIKTSLENNVNVNTVTQGDILEIDLNKKTIFPLAHVSVSSATFAENVIRFNVQVYAMDIRNIVKDIPADKFTGNDNEIDNLNTSLAVLRRTYNELAKDKYTQDITITGEPSLELFTESRGNLLDGWSMNLQVEVPDTIMSVC